MSSDFWGRVYVRRISRAHDDSLVVTGDYCRWDEHGKIIDQPPFLLVVKNGSVEWWAIATGHREKARKMKIHGPKWMNEQLVRPAFELSAMLEDSNEICTLADQIVAGHRPTPRRRKATEGEQWLKKQLHTLDGGAAA